MSNIFDDIDSDLVRSYFHPDGSNVLDVEKSVRSARNVLNFLEWAYDRDYLSFSKYQQYKDLIDSDVLFVSDSKVDGLLEQAQNSISTSSDPDPQKLSPKKSTLISEVHSHSENFFLRHAYLILPLLTTLLCILAYFAFFTQQQSFKGDIQNRIVTISPNANETQSYLSFQGKIHDANGIPITKSTNVRFRLYDNLEAGNTLYDSNSAGICTIEPIVSGTIQVDIGRTCGPPLPQNLVESSSPVWLGITVGTDPEMQPRKKVVFSSGGLAERPLSGQEILSNQSDTLLFSDNFTISTGQNLKLESSGNGDVIVHASDSGHIRFLTGGSQAIDIANNGNVGIHKDDPQFTLDVLGNVNIDSGQLKIGSFSSNPPSIGQGAIFFNTEDKKIYYSNGESWKTVGSEQDILNIVAKNQNKDYTYIVFRDNEGKIIGSIHKNEVGGITYSSSGSDFAEYFKWDLTTSYNQSDRESGTLVCDAGNGITPCVEPIGNTAHTTPQHIVGVLSDNPAFVGGGTFSGDSNYALVGMLGQLEVKVVNDGIKQGDALTISTHRGYAKKATDKGYIIGYALETPHTTGVTIVKTHIQPSYYDPITYSGKPNIDYSPAVFDKVIAYIKAVTIQVETLIADVINTNTLKARSIESDAAVVRNIQGESIKVRTVKAASLESDTIDEIKSELENIRQQTSIETISTLRPTISSSNSIITALSSGSKDTPDTHAPIGGIGGITGKQALAANTLNVNTGNANAGESLLPAGQKSIFLLNANVKSNSLIYLTNTSTTQNRTLYIAEKRSCSPHTTQSESLDSTCTPYFKVSVDTPLDQDITFNWWMLKK